MPIIQNDSPRWQPINMLQFLGCISLSKGRPKKKKKKIRLDFFVFDKFTCLLYKILPTNLVASKPAFRTFYTSHLLNNKNGSDEKCSQ